LLGADGKLPASGAVAWDWILAKDVLEHLTHEQIRFTLAEFFASSVNVFAAVPLGDGEQFIIPEMDLDVTHITHATLAWWSSQFYLRGFSRVTTAYQMPGVKDNWTQAHPFGNGFIIAS
jgi:hypothetical protein